MRRRVKARRTRAVIKHDRRNSTVEPPAVLKEEHKSNGISQALEEIVRKPLNTAHTSRNKKKRRKNKAQKKKLLALFAERLQATHVWNGKTIRPRAVLEWLDTNEPYSAQYLLENAGNLSYNEGDDAADPVFSSELDSIITRFSSSKIDNVSSQENEFLNVPKDYRMVLTPYKASGHADHETLMVDLDEKHSFITRLQSGHRAPRAMSVASEDEDMLDTLGRHIASSQPQHSSLETVIEEDSEQESRSGQKKAKSDFRTKRGFDAVQVLKRHAISFEEPSMPETSNLDTPIHPIFSEENFHGCPQNIYDVLKPGLRLCTLLLTHRATSAFWLTLCFGIRTSTANPNVKRIAKDIPHTRELAAEYTSRLASFAKSIHFHFGLYPTPTHTMDYSYASMHPIKDHLVGWQPKPGEPCRRSRVRLHTDFYTTARKLGKLKNPDPAMVLRFHFFFAVNMAHEMAHFLEMSNWTSRRRDVYGFDARVLEVMADAEPYFNEQGFNELGAAFETKVFGGRIEPISCRVDCAYGIATSDQPCDTAPETMTRTFWTVPMAFVAMLQRQGTWDSLGDAEGEVDWRVFHIPRDGAVSVSVPYFDMTVWKDESTDGRVSDVHLKRETPFKRVERGIVRVEEVVGGVRVGG